MSNERDDILSKINLPKDFGPNHPDWKVPSKRNRYIAAFSKSTSLEFGQDLSGAAADAKKSGIAVSTFFGPNTPPERFEIFLASIYSLLATNYPGRIVIVDDGSVTHKHLLAVAHIPGIQTIYRRSNGGIARCKNTGINQLTGCEYLFLADDDVLYNGPWWEPYITASKVAGIGHFSYYEEGWNGVNPQGKVVSHQGIDLVKHEWLGGAFMFMDRDTINDVGGFRVLPKKYGGEHANYSHRCLAARKMPFFCDVVESKEHIKIVVSSAEFSSVHRATRGGEAENGKHINDVKKIKEPIEE